MISPDSRLRAFAYVNAEKAPLYRAVMRVFVAAKSRFVLHLRPREIAAALAAGDPEVTLEEEELDAVLTQLCGWGNLESHPDTTDVTTVEDFYRQRFLYQLTPPARRPSGRWPSSTWRCASRRRGSRRSRSREHSVKSALYTPSPVVRRHEGGVRKDLSRNHG